ncbi:MAG: maltose alpha-D-glucosyltransferase [Elusimicrobia bacterium CG_4_10_14_0_2_um_filter_56_8]|nr:MAG: maltose alpha-D-glucosyltransferase [Elusimicrobia bacterium CG_4_10_14_0_2_um_filter_56_8]
MAPSKKKSSSDSQWYKDAVIYELHVKSFCDSNGDGVGDFRGLIERLPHLQSLGVTAVWLLPFYPSPLRDDGYDISDYYGINPEYGEMGDFKDFLKEAHKRGIRVITELVVNHTSDQHPWFQRARLAPPGSAARNYYVWSDSQEKYKDARIIFKDFETSNWAWDPVAKAYYWHRFYHHQPDLNFENPHVQKSIFKAMDFWLGLGVDGLRLDAVPYLYETEGTNCENLPATHEFLKKLRAHVDSKFKHKMLLCEANQWPEDAAAYFGAGDECNMAFHFPVMPRLFMSLWMEDSFPVTDILDQTPAIPEPCQWAVFLRNHDELTLEMVTDEERDYMYKVYARDAKARINLGIRRRLAPLLGNNRRKIELMNILLFSLPGTPVLYYGDEIGMGDNFYLGDRNGVRTPMQWSPDRNAGFSKANPQKLFLPVVVESEYHYEAINVESQEGNLSSLLWWMKRVIAMRANFKAFGRGSFEHIRSDNPKIIAFVRRLGDEIILVVANLSRFSQAAGLDLAKYAGYIPVEVFSGSGFPVIKEQPYLLTPGFQNYYWFQLKKKADGKDAPQESKAADLKFPDSTWNDLFETGEGSQLEAALADYARKCRCFGKSAAGLRRVKIAEHFPLASGARLVVLEVSHAEGRTDKYLLPLVFFTGEKADKTARNYPQSLIASLELSGEKGLLFDGVNDAAFHADLLSLFISRKKLRSAGGELRAQPAAAFRKTFGSNPMPAESRVLKAGVNGVSIVYGNHYILRFCRRVEEGVSPDVEIGSRLEAGFAHSAPGLGALNLSRGGRFYGTLGVLRGFIPNQGDSWALMLDQAAKYYDAVKSSPAGSPLPSAPELISAVDLKAIPPQVVNLTGAVSFEMAELLGRRTGEMHIALASGPAQPDFVPESFSRLYQRSVYQSISGRSKKAFINLAKRLKGLSVEAQAELKYVIDNQQRILKLMQHLMEKKFSGRKIRIHGNYYLSQALFTGKDFVIKGFEGDHEKPMGERRIKRSPLRDVAGMLLSLYYAAHAPFILPGEIPRKEMSALAQWTDLWYAYAAGAFLHGYLSVNKDSQLLPQTNEEFYLLLKIFMAEKAMIELDYEASGYQEWAFVPARLLRRLLDPACPEVNKVPPPEGKA